MEYLHRKCHGGAWDRGGGQDVQDEPEDDKNLGTQSA